MGRSRDVELVEAIERAYRDGYRSYLRVAVGVLGDLDGGRDAVQETFARALRSRGELREIESVRGWLWRTLTNVCLVEKRRTRDRPALSLEPAPDGSAEAWPELRSIIAALPERQRMVLFLRHYADLDYQQIADTIGVERGTVAATLHNAHKKIRQAMTEVHQ